MNSSDKRCTHRNKLLQNLSDDFRRETRGQREQFLAFHCHLSVRLIEDKKWVHVQNWEVERIEEEPSCCELGVSLVPKRRTTAWCRRVCTKTSPWDLFIAHEDGPVFRQMETQRRALMRLKQTARYVWCQAGPLARSSLSESNRSSVILHRRLNNRIQQFQKARI